MMTTPSKPSITIPVSKISDGEIRILQQVFGFTHQRNGVDHKLTAPDDSTKSSEMIRCLKNRVSE